MGLGILTAWLLGILNVAGKGVAGQDAPQAPLDATASAKAEMEKARQFCKDNPKDLAGQVRVWEKVIWEVDRTPFLNEAKAELETAKKRLKDSLAPELVGIDERWRGHMGKEEFGNALNLLEKEKKRHETSDWTLSIDKRIRETLDQMAILFRSIKQQAVDARLRNDADALRALRARVTKWGVKAYLADLDSIREVPAPKENDVGWIDLIPLIDPALDALKGTWKSNNGILTVESSNTYDRIEIPYMPPDEYDFRIDFIAQEDNVRVAQILSKSHTQFMWGMGWGPRREFLGFEIISGNIIGKNIATTTGSYAKAQLHTSLVEVRSDRIRAYLDGKLMVEHRTDWSDLSIWPGWKLRNGNVLGLGTQDPTVFRRVDIKEIKGVGAKTRGIKYHIPDKDVRERYAKEIRDLFKEEYSKGDRASRRALGAKLLLESQRTLDKDESKYVLLAEARDLGIMTFDLDLAFSALGTIITKYEHPGKNAGELMLEMLAKAQINAKEYDDARTVGLAYCDVARGTMRHGLFDFAIKATKEAEKLSRVANKSRLTEIIREIQSEIGELRGDYDSISMAILALSAQPDDPSANLVLGRLYCLVRDDWAKGLPLLVKCADNELKLAAIAELRAPIDISEQCNIAETWLGMAEKEQRPTTRGYYAQRAHYWYSRIRDKSEGITRLRVDKRLNDIPSLHKRLVDLLVILDPYRDIIKGGWGMEGNILVNGDAGEWRRVQVPYSPPDEYDLLLTAERLEGDWSLNIGLVGGGRQFQVVFEDHPELGCLSGIHYIDGVHLRDRKDAYKGTVLSPKGATEISISVRSQGVSVTVAGRKIVGWTGGFDRLSTEDNWRVKNPKAIYIGAHQSRYIITRLKLVPLSGFGRHLR